MPPPNNITPPSRWQGIAEHTVRENRTMQAAIARMTSDQYSYASGERLDEIARHLGTRRLLTRDREHRVIHGVDGDIANRIMPERPETDEELRARLLGEIQDLRRDADPPYSAARLANEHYGTITEMRIDGRRFPPARLKQHPAPPSIWDHLLMEAS